MKQLIFNVNQFTVYDVLTGEIKETIEGHRNVISDLDWHPGRGEIVSGSVRRLEKSPPLISINVNILTFISAVGHPCAFEQFQAYQSQLVGEASPHL